MPALRTLAALLLAGSAHAALTDLDEHDMADVTATGVAIAFDEFQLAMAPTSYFEQVGSAPAGACSGSGSVAGNTRCWRRGDLRWYGINISNAGGSGDGHHWNNVTTCSSSSLDCPRGGTITHFSPFDNPYLIRAASPAGISHSGECINGATGGCTAPATPISKAIYEFLAPTLQPNYTFSWWGEMESGSTRNSLTQPLATNAGNLIKSQNIIRGNAAGSVFRLFQFTQAGNQTFGMSYHSRLRGDYRLSVAQVDPDGAGPLAISDVIGVPTHFAGTEGMYFRNVDAFIPLGQLYYQALTISAVGTSGNFEIALTPIPDTALVYNKHYALNAGDTKGYETARMNNTGGTNTADYDLTHGYSRWGSWTATGTMLGRNLINGTDGSATGDGVVFMGCSGCGNFQAFASRPEVIDKRGSHYSQQRVQNYNCNTGNAGGCIKPASGGPVTTGDFAGTLTDQCNAYGAVDGHSCYTHNGRDPEEAEYSLFGCGGNCPLGIPTPAGDATKTFPTQAVNLGDARIEGLMLNMLRVESCAAGGC
jgi:hypothetical protein